MAIAHDKTTVRRVLDEAKAAARGALTAPEAKRLCEAYGIRIPQEAVAGSAAEAAQIATRLGYPVVMKIVSPQILHKTEAGGVVVGVKSAQPRSEPSTRSSPMRVVTRRTRPSKACRCSRCSPAARR